ncbi:hypothetical protein DSO57_1011150 [Entomophthora muscae]|uniref:Uncharacterized protein n=1 Tax=Entomophthora muscae TaxID=34485 RepID=A0ACC2SV47_9FUNG|nr:hypothetical protein DSO57_1011150 [Entomophthora muscae]
MTFGLLSYNTGLAPLVVTPALKDERATAGLRGIATPPEINLEYWMEYRDLILEKWVLDTSQALGKVYPVQPLQAWVELIQICPSFAGSFLGGTNFCSALTNTAGGDT